MTRRWPISVWIAALPLLGWWMTGLSDLDEGFYGAITREMLSRGEWITPYFAGHPWFEKPILLYWLAIPSLAAFGDMVGPRLPSVLASIGTLMMVAAFARRYFSERTAYLAPLFLGGGLLFTAIGRMMLTDALLLLCICGAFFTFWRSLEEPRYRAWFGFWLGASVLAKGPVAVLLFIPLALYVWFQLPAHRPGFRGGWITATLAFALAVASWYLPAYLANGDTFVQKFLIEQNLNRFTGGDDAHTVRAWYAYLMYIPVLILGLLPWSFFVPAAFRKSEKSDAERFLWAWAIIVFAFFTVSGAKLVHYVLPCMPPLAILTASYLQDRRWVRNVALGTVGAMVVIANVGFAYWYESSGQAEAHRLVRSLNEESGTVALYQIGRRERDKGTGGGAIRATSLPSLRLYLRRPAVDVESLAELKQLPMPAQIFTRANRISEADQDALRAAGYKVSGGADTPEAKFAVYTLVGPPKP